MPALAKDLRKKLSDVTLDARTRAESAAQAALENLAVHEREPRGHMNPDQRRLRNRLRARGRALGDPLDERTATQGLTHLVEATAYAHWHRLLFTRFLVENHLLMMPDDAGGAAVAVTIEECDELAPEMGARDGFDLACRFAARILPGVFRPDDPVLHLRLALNDEVELKGLLDSLPVAVFTASDSLGWTYQFWQAERKETVNKSGVKIGADELPAVTQLFTEDYMVDFLLDNTLGAWHAGKVLAANPRLAETARNEDELRQAVGLHGCAWSYLRFVRTGAQEATEETERGRTSVSSVNSCSNPWRPAAGSFDGWPKTAAELTCLDPCCGSGHFVVGMFERLVALRRAEEKLSEKDAVIAVLRDNLFGLELDPRCTQIAAFSLALAAWRRDGYCPLPPLHLACSGLAPNSTEAEWTALAGDNDRLKRGMARLYRLFQDGPVLGSLINPRVAAGDLIEADFHELQPLLERALAPETTSTNRQSAIANLQYQEMAVTAQGLAKAADILAGQFTLVATNVPYLGHGKQDEVLQDYCENVHPEAKVDLATCFVERALQFCRPGCSTALVTPQNWLSLGGYRILRQRLLREITWNCADRLGPGAFEGIGGEVVSVALVTLTRNDPPENQVLAAIDASRATNPPEKAAILYSAPLVFVSQRSQLGNPGGKIVLGDLLDAPALGNYASVSQGIATGDLPKFLFSWWEVSPKNSTWEFFQSTVDRTTAYGGKTLAIRWENGLGELASSPQARIQGQAAWGKRGVSVRLMTTLPCCLYDGSFFDQSSAPIVPRESSNLPAIWAFCSSNEFAQIVRSLDQALSVTESTFRGIPFQLAHWQKVAAEKYPHGLPKPYSSDPTQWLFNGHPKGSDQPLHVAVARLLGYQWPRQTGSSFPDCPALGKDGLEKFADHDGIVCLPPINREAPAADRLRELLTAALGKFDERALIAAAGPKGSKATHLEEWLRDEFFEQHCELFHQRPFVWHVWDGRKDGFHALVNYHRLDHGALQKLAYSYLGDWIRHQADDDKAGKAGAAARLGAARVLQAELVKILEGEAPYDIFVRWKPLAKQALGWHPDLNDGVRLNIRPFLTATDVGKKGAGLLRTKPNIKWEKDRGTEPARDKHEFPWFWCAEEPVTDPKPGREFTGARWNNVHLTLAAKKQAAKHR